MKIKPILMVFMLFFLISVGFVSAEENINDTALNYDDILTESSDDIYIQFR